MPLTIRVLQPQNDRSPFRSGDIDLDRFFHRFADQKQFRYHLGVTYVAVEGETILGFATLSVASLEASELGAALKRKLPGYPLPVLRFARLAVHEDAQGQGIGRSLLRFVFELAHDTARRLGCVGVVVDAKQDAIPFYKGLGFIRLVAEAGVLGDRPAPTPMFLELGAVPTP